MTPRTSCLDRAMSPRRRWGAFSTGGGRTLPPCLGYSNVSLGRFGNAKCVWPPAHLQVAHPSLGMAALVEGARFRARATLDGLARDVVARGGGGGGGGGGDKEEEDAVSKLIDKYGDRIGQVGFGGTLGFCSGYAMIKVGKSIAFLIGVGFIVAQGLNYSGVVNIKWSKVEDKAKSLLDANGDRKLDKEDAKVLWKRVKAALMTNLPAGGGFGGGFALGLCCG